ncbi:unnamed protein product, partial [Brassica rapa]
MEFVEGNGRRDFTADLNDYLLFVLAFFSLANRNQNYGFLVFNLSLHLKSNSDRPLRRRMKLCEAKTLGRCCL